MFDIMKIKETLPHGYPFLLIDKIIEFNDSHVTAIKNVTFNENFFVGHFREKPVMPGVLIVESLAQTGAFLLLSKEEHKGKIVYFAGIENFKFKNTVMPGDTLKLHVDMLKFKMNFGKASAKAFVEEKIVAEGTISFIIKD